MITTSLKIYLCVISKKYKLCLSMVHEKVMPSVWLSCASMYKKNNYLLCYTSCIATVIQY